MSNTLVHTHISNEDEPENTLAHAEDPPEASLAERYPWSTFLPERDREAFALERAELPQVGRSTDRRTALAELIDDWRNTARIHAESGLATALAADIDKPLDRLV